MSKSCPRITFMRSEEFANNNMLYTYAVQVFYIIVNLNDTSEDTAAAVKIIEKSHVM